jgi:hypothetical protein
MAKKRGVKTLPSEELQRAIQVLSEKLPQMMGESGILTDQDLMRFRAMFGAPGQLPWPPQLLRQQGVQAPPNWPRLKSQAARLGFAAGGESQLTDQDMQRRMLKTQRAPRADWLNEFVEMLQQRMAP